MHLFKGKLLNVIHNLIYNAKVNPNLESNAKVT